MCLRGSMTATATATATAGAPVEVGFGGSRDGPGVSRPARRHVPVPTIRRGHPCPLPRHPRPTASSGAFGSRLRSAYVGADSSATRGRRHRRHLHEFCARSPMRMGSYRERQTTRVIACLTDEAAAIQVARGRRVMGAWRKWRRDVPRPRVRTGMSVRAVSHAPMARRPPPEPGLPPWTSQAASRDKCASPGGKNLRSSGAWSGRRPGALPAPGGSLEIHSHLHPPLHGDNLRQPAKRSRPWSSVPPFPSTPSTRSAAAP